MTKLVMRTGPHAGMEYPLDRPVIRLGRGSGSDIVLPGTQASRQHAEISRQGDTFFIRDLGSTNGTFVNNERISAPRPLRPGDQVKIGDLILAYEAGPMAAAGAPATDWEAQLWDDVAAEQPSARRGSRFPVWGLVGIVVVLLLAVAAGAVWVLRGRGTATPVVEQATAVPSVAITVAVAASQEPAAVEPTDTPLVEAPAVEPIDTVALEATLPAVPTVEVPAATAPIPQALPTSAPVSPSNLEALPSAVTQFLGDVPPEQLPQVISTQMQTLSQEELQAMIASLFPGVDPAQLPGVVAASFPGISQAEIEALLGQVFPGQTFQLPQVGGPVGGRIALGISKEGGGYDLHLVNAMGGGSNVLVELASEPDFSPDGQWLVYYSGNPEKLGLRLIKVDGSEDTELTTSSDHGYPSFSPDGQRIVFHHYGQDEMYVINRDGSGEHGIGKGQYPAWSPTGDQVVYRGCVGGGKCGLIVANANGSNPRQITTVADDAAPRWSPNGGQIVFHSNRDGNWEVYVINSDGSWLRRITTHAASDVMPIWSPDGLRIAFRSDRGGKGAVWVTTGIGGPPTKVMDAALGTEWAFDQMDWSK